MRGAEAGVGRWVAMGVGVVAISFASILIRLASAPASVIAAYRMVLATLVLLPLLALRGGRDLTSIGRQDAPACLLAGAFLGLHFALWTSSLQQTSVASSVVLVTTNPLFVGVASALLLHERPGRPLITAIALSASGAALIGLHDLGAPAGSLRGDLLALLGALMASGYLLVGRRVRPRLPLLSYITLVYGTAALLLLLLVLALGHPLFTYPRRDYLLFLLLALGPQLVGHSMFNWALRYFPATTVALAILGEPVGSSLLALVLLGEGLGALKVLGGGLVLGGIFLAAREPGPPVTVGDR